MPVAPTDNGDGHHRPSIPTMKLNIRNPINRIRDIVTNHSHESQTHITDIDHAEVITLLSSERRRHTIEFLANQPADETVPVSDIAEGVAALENNCTPEELTAEDRRRVYISLHQQHLPLLENDVVEYDPGCQEVTPTETPARIWRAFSSFQRALAG